MDNNQDASKDERLEKKTDKLARILSQTLDADNRENVRHAIHKNPMMGDCDIKRMKDNLERLKNEEVEAFRLHVKTKQGFPFVPSIEPELVKDYRRFRYEDVRAALIANASIRTDISLKDISEQLSQALSDLDNKFGVDYSDESGEKKKPASNPSSC